MLLLPLKSSMTGSNPSSNPHFPLCQDALGSIHFYLILSVMPYTMSFFGLNTKELNCLRQTAVGFILKRHWIAAEILPYILRYLKIAPMLDPGLSALVAALGLYLREGNPVEELTSEVQHANCNRRQLSIVKELIDMWAPFVNFAEIFEAVSRPAKSSPC